jgi:hypothetical protein
MKRLITTLALTLMVFVANAQFRITPMININVGIYNEVLEIITVMERASYIEKMEGKSFNTFTDKMATSGGEVMVQRCVDYIKVYPTEFTKMINDYYMHSDRRWYPIESIRNELMIQNVDMFKYINTYLSSNRRIKNVYIKYDSPPGGTTYIRIDYYHNL